MKARNLLRPLESKHIRSIGDKNRITSVLGTEPSKFLVNDNFEASDTQLSDLLPSIGRAHVMCDAGTGVGYRMI